MLSLLLLSLYHHYYHYFVLFLKWTSYYYTLTLKTLSSNCLRKKSRKVKLNSIFFQKVPFRIICTENSLNLPDAATSLWCSLNFNAPCKLYCWANNAVSWKDNDRCSMFCLLSHQVPKSNIFQKYLGECPSCAEERG